MRVTHPFHPLHGREFIVVTIRNNWGEDRVYYHDEGGHLQAIPAAWTDAMAADPTVVISAGRAPFRLQDLAELARLVERIRKGGHDGS